MITIFVTVEHTVVVYLRVSCHETRHVTRLSMFIRRLH
jgi:hypothetical protein